MANASPSLSVPGTGHLHVEAAKRRQGRLKANLDLPHISHAHSIPMTEQRLWIDRKGKLLYLNFRNASATLSRAIFTSMFGKQERDEVFAKLIGKPHTEKPHQLLTIRRDGCINPSAVWAHSQPGKTPGFHQMTRMLAERLVLLS